MVLGQSGEISVQVRKGLVVAESRLGRNDKTVRHEGRQEGGCEQWDGVFRICGVVQERQEWLVRFGVRNEGVGERGDVCSEIVAQSVTIPVYSVFLFLKHTLDQIRGQHQDVLHDIGPP